MSITKIFKIGGIFMPVSLSKGQKVELTKGNPGLSKLLILVGILINMMVEQILT